MRIAVVIPALEEAPRIAAAVRSARAPDVEVVVADGGSRDATRERAEAEGARVVRAPRGRAAQLEAGAKACDAPVLLFLHADSRLPPGFAEAVRAALAEPGVAGGAFAFRFEEGDPALRWIEWGARMRSRWARLPYGDQALFLRREVLERMGGVPQVSLMEDLDLAAGLRRFGRLALLPRPVTTSARRYRGRGVLRTFLRNALALAAWRLGADRERLARWYRA